MITALLLIFRPTATWDRILQARRSPGFLLVCYLLPMMLLTAAAEGYGMVTWGKPQWNIHRLQKFTMGETVIYEAGRALATLIIVAVCAHLIKMFAESFRERNTYQQTFTLAIYGLSPLFLMRLLDGTPGLSPWITWAAGILLCCEVLYQGVPPVLDPDPPSAFGLFFMSALVVAATTGMERFITAWFLNGRLQPVKDFIDGLLHHLSR